MKRPISPTTPLKVAFLTLLLAVLVATTARAQSTDPIYKDWYGTGSGTAGNTGEDRQNLIDGDKTTKWCVVGHDFTKGTIYIEFETVKPFVPTGYVLTTGTDSKQYTGRNPKSWIIRAKHNRDDHWESLDNYLIKEHPTEDVLALVSGDTKLQDVNSQDYEYKLCTITNGTESTPYEITRTYQYFRIDFLETKGSTEFQLSEFQFRGHRLTTDLSTLTANYTASHNEVLTGTLPSNLQLSIADAAEVTLSGVTINSSVGPGIDCLGHATLILADGTTNNVTGHDEFAGIRITDAEMPDDYYGGLMLLDKSYVLTIKGGGTLNAYGKGGGAGIGSDFRGRCGEIHIEGGTVNAYGSTFAAGIGAGGSGHCDDIKIFGGTVRAEGMSGGAGIGSGFAYPIITLTNLDPSVFEDPYFAPIENQDEETPDSSSCKSVTIARANVIANGGWGAPGIGSGACWNERNPSTCGDIDICGTGTIVTATGDGYPGIGAGRGKSTCGDIIITNEVQEVKAIMNNNTGLYSIGKLSGEEYATCGTVTIEGEETGFPSQNPFTYRPGHFQKITFNANEGTGTMKNLYFSDIDNSSWPLTANTFTRQYYTFAGWNTEADGSGANYINGQSISVSSTLYAQWDEIDRTLADGTAYTQTSDLDVISASYTKTLGSDRVGKHQSWLVPFDYTITSADLEKFTFYKINMIANSPSPSVEATDEMWVFLTKLDAGAVLHANMPYVYKPKEAVTDYEFTSSYVTLKAKNTGVLMKTETAEDVYSFYASYGPTAATAQAPFYYIATDGTVCYGDNVTLGALRWLIRKTNKYGEKPTYARQMHFFDGEGDVTGIETIDNGPLTMDNGAWFTIDGRKLSQKPTVSGIYINGGRKVVIR